MLQAQQRALLQETNQGLIAIRQIELDYYTTFYATFGGQSALIGGFVYSAVTQSNIYYGFQSDEVSNTALLTTWWIVSAVCLAASMHCIFTTILLQVLGSGLALTGPLGSMAKATKGLHEEMHQVFVAYLVMVLTFGISVVMSFWLVMKWESSLICTCIFGIACRQWWFYCSRIYNRFYEPSFYLGERAVKFENRDTNDLEDVQSPMSMKNGTINVNIDATTNNSGISNSNSNYNDGKVNGDQTSVYRINDNATSRGGYSGGKKSGGLFNIFSYKPGKMSEFSETVSSYNHNNSSSNSSSSSSNDGNNSNNNIQKESLLSPVTKTVTMEGYLTRKGLKNEAEKDERLYFVLMKNALLHFYKGRKDYQNGSTTVIRPIDIRNYRLRIVTNANDESISDTVSVTGRGLSAQFLLFEMRLEAKDASSKIRNWTLRCDTQDELELWTDAFTKFTSVVDN